MITSNTIRNEQEALAFMAECTLATVCHMAGLSRPNRSELRRQIAIAQTGVDWCRTIEAIKDMRGVVRVQDIIERKISVEDWAKERMPKLK